jgi:acyl-CoA reductase-like NAD-dependent aldehyde dehydrogenase
LIDVARPGEARTLIDGRWRAGDRTVEVRSPYDGRAVGLVHETTAGDVDAAVASARAAYATWRLAPAHRRSALLHATAALVRRDAEAMAQLLTAHTGKTIRESRTEVTRSASVLELSAEEAGRIGGEVIPMDALPPGEGRFGLAFRVPLGVIAGIGPFNAPLSVVCHKLAPAIAAGNTFVLKPHPAGSAVSAVLAAQFLEAGLPPGVLNLVHGGPEVGGRLCRHRDVALVNFTGSGRVADVIVREIGLKRTVLELGGNAPTIVHADADLDNAVARCADAAFALAGQTCVSTQRIYVHRSLFEPFVAGLAGAARARRPGDPAGEDTGVGPLIDQAAAERVERWIGEAVAAGARLVCGGQRTGALLAPAVLTGVADDMSIMCEEVFGPVASVIPYDTLEEAIDAANRTPWGLKAGVFTRSIEVALRAARDLEYGTVNVNGASRSRVDHEPSGGVKQSGWGTEGPRYAIEDMTDLKMVSVVPS